MVVMVSLVMMVILLRIVVVAALMAVAVIMVVAMMRVAMVAVAAFMVVRWWRRLPSFLERKDGYQGRKEGYQGGKEETRGRISRISRTIKGQKAYLDEPTDSRRPYCVLEGFVVERRHVLQIEGWKEERNEGREEGTNDHEGRKEEGRKERWKDSLLNGEQERLGWGGGGTRGLLVKREGGLFSP
jgi:hypothetical protein